MSGVRTIKVFFLDADFKQVSVADTATGEQLHRAVCEKIALSDGVCELFGVFEQLPDGSHRSVAPSERVLGMGEATHFVFKKKLVLKDDDREMQDLACRHLLYLQAASALRHSEFALSVADAALLAALQLRIEAAGSAAGVDDDGRGVPTVADCRAVLPSLLWPTRKPAEWVSLIARERAQFRSLSATDGEALYVARVRRVSPTYGVTFFGTAKALGAKKAKNANVAIGVGADGIVVVRAKDRELLSSHKWPEIATWFSSTTLFGFEYGTLLDLNKATFETTHAPQIAQLMQTYVDVEKAMLEA
jgi:hypothetical protein